MSNIERLLKALEIIHSTASPRVLQDNLFHVFEHLYHFPRINLIVFDRNTSPRFLAFKNMDPDYVSLYQEFYYQKDVFVPSKVELALRDRFVLTYADVTTLSEFKRGEYYNDFIRPQGIEQMLMISIPLEEDRSFVIGLACAMHDTLDKKLLQELNTLARHIRIAIEHSERYEVLEKCSELVEAFSNCACLDVVLLRNDLKPVFYTNNCSNRFLQEDHGLLSGQGSVKVPSTVKALVDQIRERMRKDKGKTGSQRALRRVSRGEQSLEIEILPFREFSLSTGGGYLVLLKEKIYPNERCKRILRNDFNVSDREIDMISLIIHGYSNKEIANSLCISLPTVKGHIQNIFEKMNIKSRTQLCCRVIRMIVQDLDVST